MLSKSCFPVFFYRVSVRFFFFMIPPPPRSTLFPYTTLFRSGPAHRRALRRVRGRRTAPREEQCDARVQDRKSTRLNSSHEWISYAVFCLKKKKKTRKNLNIDQIHR